MKKLPVLLVSLIISVSSFGQRDSFTVRVTIEELKSENVVLVYEDAQGFVMDDHPVKKNNVFTFSGRITSPRKAFIAIRDKSLNINLGWSVIPSPSFQFILSNSSIQINGKGDKIYMAEAKGGYNNDASAQEFGAAYKKIVDEDWLYRKKQFETFFQTKDSAFYYRGDNRKQETDSALIMLKEKFIVRYPSDFLSVVLLYDIMEKISSKELDRYYEGLSLPVQKEKNSLAYRIFEKINAVRASAIGQPASNFSRVDHKGSPFKLSDLKGKYVILDFWGSWCGPCRKSSPQIKKLYERYQSKGLEIVGVSYELSSNMSDNKANWQKAIEEDKTPWIHILNNDLTDGTDIISKYDIKAYPTFIIINPAGKIISRVVGADPDQVWQEIKKVMGE